MKILLGMSGGLDSTYAAHKLVAQGHTVEGAVLKMHGYTEVDEARAAAEGLGIPLHVIDCREEFEKRVVGYFLSEYPKGRTPNPCVVCNSEIKFRALLNFAKDNGFDFVATGHYARVIENDCNGKIRYTLSCAEDINKDQTYVLWRLPQDILSRLLLPLCDSKKAEIREESATLGIMAADRGESQEICFIPSGEYAEFIEERIGASLHGDFIDENGNVLGEHKGIIRYTLGQRKGLGIAMGARVFVTEINPQNNTVTLSKDASYTDEIYVSDMNFVGICEPEINEETELLVKVRYLAPKVKCSFKYLGDGRGMAKLAIPQRAVTPGQSAVFYKENYLACGGFID